MVYNFYIEAFSSPYATVIALICAGFMIAGENVFSRGRAERQRLVRDSIKGMDAKRDIERLFKATKHKDWQVRSSVVEALGRIRDTRGVEPLIQALKDKEPPVRKKCCGGSWNDRGCESS